MCVPGKCVSPEISPNFNSSLKANPFQTLHVHMSLHVASYSYMDWGMLVARYI